MLDKLEISLISGGTVVEAVDGTLARRDQVGIWAGYLNGNETDLVRSSIEYGKKLERNKEFGSFSLNIDCNGYVKGVRLSEPASSTSENLLFPLKEVKFYDADRGIMIMQNGETFTLEGDSWIQRI